MSENTLWRLLHDISSARSKNATIGHGGFQKTCDKNPKPVVPHLYIQNPFNMCWFISGSKSPEPVRYTLA